VTDGLDQALVDAGVALLVADASLAVYPGGLPNQLPPAPPIPPPYVVVYGYVEWPTGVLTDSLDGLSGSPVVNWIAHCVGGGEGATPADAEKSARAVAQRVRTAWLNKRPTVTGLDLGMIRFEPSGAVPQPDNSTGVLLSILIVHYRLSAGS
jgi:hypothetical protein